MQDETGTGFTPLSQLLPPSTGASATSPPPELSSPKKSDSVSSMTLPEPRLKLTPWFKPEEKLRARAGNLRDCIRRGWQYVGGWLVKDTKKLRPSWMIPSLLGDPRWNPREDATAVRLGGVFVMPNHYRHPDGFYMDHNGMLKSEDQCPICGSTSEGEYKWQVPKRDYLTSKIIGWTYCTRCVTAADLEENRQRMAGNPHR